MSDTNWIQNLRYWYVYFLTFYSISYITKENILLKNNSECFICTLTCSMYCTHRNPGIVDYHGQQYFSVQFSPGDCMIFQKVVKVFFCLLQRWHFGWHLWCHKVHIHDGPYVILVSCSYCLLTSTHFHINNRCCDDDDDAHRVFH